MVLLTDAVTNVSSETVLPTNARSDVQEASALTSRTFHEVSSVNALRRMRAGRRAPVVFLLGLAEHRHDVARTNGMQTSRADHVGPSLEVFPDRKTSWDRAVCRCLSGKHSFIPKNHHAGIHICES